MGRKDINMAWRGLLSYLQTRYNIGIQYDTPHSFADVLTRYLYARAHQTESMENAKEMARQRRSAGIMFRIRGLVRKWKLGTIPIRIVFLAQDPLDWLSLDSVYRACTSLSCCKTYVVNIGFSGFGDYRTDCSEVLRRQNIPFLDGVNGDVRLDHLNPDLIAVSSPYDEYRPAYYRTANLLRFGQIVYTCYGPDFADKKGVLAKQTFGNETQKHAWRIFSRSDRTVEAYKKHGNVSPGRVVCLGHPRFDQFYVDLESDPLPETIASAGKGKFKVVYAPHHSLAGWSTFPRFAEHIRNLVRENPDLFLVFRPHPLLMTTLKRANVLTEEAFRSFFSGDRCALYEGNNYYQLFRWSDLLVSDASSFLVEYAPTRKPIVYLHREDGWGGLDDTLSEDVNGSCYIARTGTELSVLLQELKNGRDPMKDDRISYQEKMNVGMFSGGAGQRISDYIQHALA